MRATRRVSRGKRNWKEFRTAANSFGTRFGRGGVSFSVGRDHRDRDRCDQPPCSMHRPTPLHRLPSFSPHVLLFTLLLSSHDRNGDRVPWHAAANSTPLFLLPSRRHIAKLFQMLIARLYATHDTRERHSSENRTRSRAASIADYFYLLP